MNILYIGPNYSEWGQEHCPCSLAAAKWARGFLTALSKMANITALTHAYYFPWPKGSKIWCGRDNRLHPDGWDYEVVSYPVLRYVRELWWRFAYAALAKRIILKKNIDVVLIYNCYESWQVPVLRTIKKVYPSVKIVPIILDGDDPRKDNWGWLRKAACYSDAFIPLSWWVHCNLPANTGKPSYHFDGGADGWKGTEVIRGRPLGGGKANQYTLVHTGALDQWRGLDFMVGVVRSVIAKRNDVRFIFTGKSSGMALEKIFGGNPHIELSGFVSENGMAAICNSADILMNVRTPDHPDNILNYPSKLPHYLSFGRPVVSTRLQSLSPDYTNVVHYPVDDTIEAYVRKLEEVLAWDDDTRQKEYFNIKEWFLVHKTWDVIVKGLVDWLKEIVK